MKQFSETLLHLRETAGITGIVYGGCLRDTYCETGPVKDIDVAVDYSEEAYDRIKWYGDRYGNDKPTVYHLNYWVGSKDAVKSITIPVDDGLPLNFVLVDMPVDFTVQNVAERCDFGICHIALDKYGLWCGAWFAADYHNRTFTYLRDPRARKQVQRSIKRWERLAPKYPGWTPIIPDYQWQGTAS